MSENPTIWERETDLIKRDPNDLNDHLSVNFEDALGEPDHTHSVDCVWRYSFKCFNLWRDLCYKILTAWFGVCIAMSLGCEFSYIAFYHIWILTPCMKIYVINANCVGKFWQSMLTCCIDPLCISCGKFFHMFSKKDK